MKTEPQSNNPAAKYAAFGVTQWSIVQSASAGSSSEAHAALEALCSIYWQPLYCYIRRRGYNEEDAKDATQAFFARLLDKNYLAAVDRRKGKFRSFLLASLHHFLLNHRRDARAQKRGGGVSFISFDDAFDETLFANNPAFHVADPEHFYEMQWAIAVLNQVFLRLRTDFLKKRNLALFEDLKAFITFENSDAYAKIAAKHGMTAAAVKQAAHRLKKKYGELIMEVLANTVSTPEEVEEEKRALFAAFSR